MIKRDFWIKKIESAWLDRTLIWLSGVRRVGKTSLCQSLEDVEYYNCELPRVQDALTDPEQFYLNKQGKRIILDEIHVLKNPSIVLKIAADHFPETKVIATGSSTLGAQKKFSDTLAGRKNNIVLPSMLIQESALFGNDDLPHRFLFGGLPSFFMRKSLPEEHYAEWFSSYFARDVRVLYTVSSEESFIKFVKLILAQSGSIFDATRFSHECEVSRPTIVKYLHIAEQTYVAKIVRPFSNRSATEIISAPKVYGFDTGFVCYAKGLEALSDVHYGDLWEHIVLNTIFGMHQNISIKYWRDKRGHEIDFVLQKNRNIEPIAVECKWNHRSFSPINLKAFRNRHPKGRNFVVAPDIVEPFDKRYDDLVVTFVTLEQLNNYL